MSKERELLESAIEYLYDLQGAWLWKENEVAGNGEEYNDLDNLVVKIREHLSQPDQGPKSSREFYQEGYAQAEMDLKRKRITDEEIYNRCCAMDNSYTCNFIDGVEWAEEHHGITGVDNESI